jgi:hypothetical protein
MLPTPISTIPAAAVAMRTSALTCIRSKATRPRTTIAMHVSRSGGSHVNVRLQSGFRRVPDTIMKKIALVFAFTSSKCLRHSPMST